MNTVTDSNTPTMRLQDGTIENANDFWQLIQDVAYILEGEPKEFARRQLEWLSKCLDEWFSKHPEIVVTGSLDDFAMCSVRRLVDAVILPSGRVSDGITLANARKFLADKGFRIIGRPDPGDQAPF